MYMAYGVAIRGGFTFGQCTSYIYFVPDFFVNISPKVIGGHIKKTSFLSYLWYLNVRM